MTRKRFIKLCMAIGYSRNEANAMAERARRYGMSYAARWELVMDFRVSPAVEFITGLAQGLRETIPGIVEAASKLAADAAAAVKELTQKAIPIVQRIVKNFDVSLVASGGVPLNYGQNCDGLRTHVVLADEWGSMPPRLTQEQIDTTTATVAGGAANGD